MVRYFIIYTILTLSPIFSFGQEITKKNTGKLIFSPGISYQKQFFGEINMMYSKIEEGHGVIANWGPRVGIEANFSGSNFIYAPKIGYELDAVFLALRGNLINYIDKGNVDLRILPEAGLSFFGAVNLTYGYGIPLLKFESVQISRHRITLTINLNSKLWGRI